MFQQWMNIRVAYFLVIVLFLAFVISYTHTLSTALSALEKQKVEEWIEAEKTIVHSTDSASLSLASKIAINNTDIPIIETNEAKIPTGNYVNLELKDTTNLIEILQQKVKEFGAWQKPIEVVLSDSPYVANFYFYGESKLAKQIRRFPYLQFLIALALLITSFVAQRNYYKNSQNQLWVGMSKETAHQLGTPVSSLKGWIEILKGNQAASSLPLEEIEKDIEKLEVITDRFGKIGSKPQLIPTLIAPQLEDMIVYMQQRAGKSASFQSHIQNPEAKALISPTLFDWVIENLLKNALDATEGKGSIQIKLFTNADQAFIQIIDNGKGISAKHQAKIFDAGFSTKSRGWGLGLALSKRIIEQYHQGKISLLYSEKNMGTCFQITIPTLKE